MICVAYLDVYFRMEKRALEVPTFFSTGKEGSPG